MGDITKVAVLDINKEGVFMCIKEGVGLINLGGTFEEGDSTYERCVRREVKEETGCEVRGLLYYDTFEGKRIDEPLSNIKLVCYFGQLMGEPRLQPGDKIIGFERIGVKWKDKGHKLPETSQMAMEKLVDDGYLLP